MIPDLRQVPTVSLASHQKAQKYKYIYRQKKRFQLTQIVIRKTLKNENRLELERNVHVHQIEIYSHTNKY